MNNVQENGRKKYEKIRCPECGGLSRVIQQKRIKGFSGFQIRQCSSCGFIFEYDYVIQAQLQNKRNWNCV